MRPHQVTIADVHAGSAWFFASSHPHRQSGSRPNHTSGLSFLLPTRRSCSYIVLHHDIKADASLLHTHARGRDKSREPNFTDGKHSSTSTRSNLVQRHLICTQTHNNLQYVYQLSTMGLRARTLARKDPPPAHYKHALQPLVSSRVSLSMQHD